jgi:hypothetical protein
MLRDQTSAISSRGGRIHAPRGKQRAHESRSGSIVPPTLSDDTEAGCLCFFFLNYVNLAHDKQSVLGPFCLLMPLYNKVRHDSPLSLATSALAINMTAMLSGKDPDLPLARTYFGEALALTKAAIDDPIQSTSDETLLTVLLLEMYEKIGCSKTSSSSSGAHQGGAVALIRHRGSLNFQSDFSKRLLLAVRHDLIDTALDKGAPISPDPAVWNDGTAMPASPAVSLDELAAEVTSLNSMANEFNFQIPLGHARPFSRTPSPSAFVTTDAASKIFHEILGPAVHLEVRLSAWCKSLPPF